jgi:hypothetical protein
MKAVRLRHLASSRVEGGNHDRATSSRYDMVAAMPKLRAFATPQSYFISIKVVAVGQRTRTNVDCINTEFAGFLALGGFAGEKIS